MRFPHVSSDGAELCAVTTEHLWSGVYGLEQHIDETIDAQIEAGVWLSLIRKALARLGKTDARQLLFRLTKSPNADLLSQRLPEVGLKKKQGRIEYRLPISELPDECGSPLRWQNMEEAGWTSAQVGLFMEKCAVGDPDYDPRESAESFMADWLKDPVLTSGPSCIELGFLGEEPVALVVAQVNPRTKWSRISYMGLLPERRGHGLGRWVHRRGFTLMRNQGGQLYHGGTHSENGPMRKLFEEHGCKVYREMEEWTFCFTGHDDGKD